MTDPSARATIAPLCMPNVPPIRDTRTSSWVGRRLDLADAFRSGAGTIVSSALLSAFGLGAAYVLFPRDTGLVAVFLVSLSLVPPFDRLLDENRRAIWEEGRSPTGANLHLAGRVLLVFLGVFLAFGLSALAVPLDRVPDLLGAQIERLGGRQSISDLRFGALCATLGHNFVVAAILFLVSLLYRSGGAVLAVSWNASVWASCLAFLSRAPGCDPVPTFGKALVIVLPHMLCELAGYVFVSLGGIFLSRALVRYDIESPRFRRVAFAVVLVVGAGAAWLALAAVLEARLAPRLLRLLFS